MWVPETIKSGVKKRGRVPTGPTTRRQPSERFRREGKMGTLKANAGADE